ncbi:Protein phosphatase 1 regulatory subunit 3B [Choanephora cucurbitarum]|uniref:Protein phosphatase 1 regulatory subunit 3B n=1 Tax=Choanephora cucurbitarum TaxID=101091 RepID=A0A1C7NC03_9FUNG|nr:Protein phosphatase 1 regulatory subunit 3B [Choanephora cucurbitarum]
MQKRVTLNKRPSLSQETQEANEYTRLLVASALCLPKTSVVKITSTVPSLPEETTQKIQLPRFLKSSLRTPKSASAPCSPTTGMKSVQFSKHNLEDICLFKKAQTPLAISQRRIFWANSDSEDESSSESDNEPERSLVFANWPNRLADMIDRKNRPIRVEKNSFRLEQDILIGKVFVRNLDYHKTVTIRYTFDFWETIDNTEAKFHEGHKAYDVFQFKITVPKNASTLYFAIHYTVGSQSYWDNNDTRNYEVQFATNRKKQPALDLSLPIKKTPSEDTLTTRYDFGQSISQAKNNPAQQQSLAMPIPSRRKSPSSSPTGISCYSPLATSPSLMDLNSQSYMELVNKYCFYSTSPSRSPMSING